MDLGWDHRLCFAGSLLVADLLGVDRTSVRVLEVPELAAKPGASPVELVVDVGGRTVSLEHTLIESYPAQIRDGQHIGEFINLVRSALLADLPRGTFTLVLTTGAVLGLTGRKAAGAAQQVADWLKREAPELANEATGRQANRQHRSSDEPIPVTLQYRRGDQRSELQFARWAPEDLEGQRQQRMSDAFNKKLPKLAVTRGYGCDPCLVLEDKDLALANPDLVTNAAKNALEEFPDARPEWILLAETLPTPAMWLVLYASGDWIDSDARQYARITVPDELTFEMHHDPD